ncbi:MAG TPA: hypothetical protein VFN25_00515 [Dokdonella sp.]|uniref:hypothetical protein n=1 Tax=Dokdonella sp. TaxID=2291710 RepID=UPI002D80B3DA|nr:hypothetical protein [Dokdonella sp.]HET9031362.1 hypothetical protein [Dokdonella sp.]
MIPDLKTRLVTFIAIALALPVVATADTAIAGHATETPTYQSTSLQPAAVDALRRKVLVQCGLDSSGNRNFLPWYFHFQYGQALLEAGDASRAIVELNQSIDLRPEPQARKRTYGMWFLDYLPYFQLAEAHAMLANWPCAEHAMELSRSTGETTLGRIETSRIRALEENIDRHLDEVGSCNLRDYQSSPSTDSASAS